MTHTLNEYANELINEINKSIVIIAGYLAVRELVRLAVKAFQPTN